MIDDPRDVGSSQARDRVRPSPTVAGDTGVGGSVQHRARMDAGGSSGSGEEA